MSEMTIYRCPSCGGEITFDSDKQKLVCPYCDTSFKVETLKEYTEEINQELKNDTKWNTAEVHETFNDDTIVEYSCEHCGGTIIGDKETIATTCPYCDSPVIMNKNVAKNLKPDYVIPFKMSKEDAKKQLNEFFRDKALLPKSFKTESTLDELKGIYIPFWTYHCLVDTKIRYNATKVRYYSDNDYNYTETKHYLVTREGTVQFNNVPVDGSSKIDDEYMQSIEPFDFKEAVPFETAYLAGYLADKYDEDSSTSEPKATKRIKKTTRSLFKKTVSAYSHTKVDKSQMKFKDKQVNYYLLPVWILNLTWEDKKYTLMMNGQTGKMIGDLPADMNLYWRSFFTITAVVFVIMFLILMVVL